MSRGPLYYRFQPHWARFWSRYLTNALFVHINKTAGSSIERALGMPFQHRTALEFIDLVGPERWDRCFTFAFVRNPWERVLSHYRYRVKTNQTGLGTVQISFGEWVRRTYGDQDPRYWDQPRMFMAQSNWLCDATGDVLVDFVGRFERLERDFAEVCRRLGRKTELPHLKPSGPRNHYAAHYDAESRAIVADRFAKDIERFGYCFDREP